MKLKTLRGESGMAMVEAVIVLPILLMLFFAIVEFGIAFTSPAPSQPIA